MAQFGKNDQTNNSPLWAAARFNLTVNTSNRDLLYSNATANTLGTNITVGVFGVDANEVQARPDLGVAHTGWVLRTVGTGGRSGRTQTEVLVAGGIGTDAEDTIFRDYTINLLTQPSSANVADAADATFTVVATTTPPGGTITYTWQFANGLALTANSNYANVNTATLTVVANSEISGNSYKVLLQTTGGAPNVTSSNVTITVS